MNSGVFSYSKSELSVVGSQAVTGQTSFHNDEVDTDRSASALTNGIDKYMHGPVVRILEASSTQGDSVSWHEYSNPQGGFGG